MLQKYLSYEEPSSRCAHLRKVLAKQLKLPATKELDLNTISQLQQDYLFDMAFGGRPTDTASRLLSVFLGLEDLQRFEEIAFASWSKESGDDAEQFGPPHSNFWERLRVWLKTLNLTDSQERWLLHCALASPNWSLLQSSGPWKDDARAEFLSDALLIINTVLKNAQGLNSDLLHRGRNGFSILLAERRQELPGDFLPNVMALVEGATEALLLPRFAELLNVDLQSHAIMTVSAGGAKQVSRRYVLLRDLVAIPIICIFDRDAEEQAAIVIDSLRDLDRVFVLQAGEIEDTFELGSFVRLLNVYLGSFPGSVQPVLISDFSNAVSRKTVLSKLWKSRHLGPFDKIAFAQSIADNLNAANDVPVEVVQILKFLVEVSTKKYA